VPVIVGSEIAGLVSVLFVRVSVVVLATRVSFAAGSVSEFEPATAGAATLIVPDVAPRNCAAAPGELIITVPPLARESVPTALDVIFTPPDPSLLMVDGRVPDAVCSVTLPLVVTAPVIAADAPAIAPAVLIEATSAPVRNPALGAGTLFTDSFLQGRYL